MRVGGVLEDHSLIEVVDPAREERISVFEAFGEAQIEAALADAHAAQLQWRAVPIADRAASLRRAAEVLRAHGDEWAQLITREMGKPISEAKAEIAKCAHCCEFYADHGESFLEDRRIDTDAELSYVAYEPIGVVLAIMPWNFPFWQALRFAAPALVAGNGAILKHSPNVSGCALAIEALFAEAGFPTGLFRTVLVADAVVGEVTTRLIEDPRVAAVTLTGSERAGAAVGAAAGRALKKSVLELGGSDPLIVLADANVALVAAHAVRGRFLNAGQTCISPKRLIVDAAIVDEFEQRLTEAVAALKVGDPLDPTTQVGPLARADLVDQLERQVERSIAAGARVLHGGTRVERPGYYFAPTVLTDVTADMPVFREEVFGPVAAVIRAADEQHAIALANDTPYGLGASVWTQDAERGVRVGRELRSGSLFVNGIVASDPRLPFGGIGRSGYGRELSSEGIREFVNARTIWVGASPPSTGTAGRDGLPR
jgi:succinate-semialdehyde dehydrogenase/glutarate-semialdehyde dehydrogenase